MRSYRMFIGVLGDQVLELLGIVENEDWHHTVGGERERGYTLLTLMLNELIERADFYVSEKGGTGEGRVEAAKLAAAKDGLDRLYLRGQHSGSWPGDLQLELDDNDRGETRLDGGPGNP